MKNRKLSTFVVIYLMLGLIFAIFFALYYHWRPTDLFSPGFYVVILTWPYQAIGFIKDIQYYGLSGKPV